MRIFRFHRKHQQELLKDARSGRVAAVIHCVLNQNARDYGAAVHKAFSEAIVSVFLEQGVGMIQMPCPEMICLGWARERPKGVGIRQALDTPWGRRCCRSLAVAVADQLEEHVRSGYAVLGVVGGDRESPGCAVHVEGRDSGDDARLSEASGVFMRALDKEFEMRGLRIPFLAMRESSPGAFQADLAALNRLLSNAGMSESVRGAQGMEGFE